ncbi:hypothetical protein J14TS5_10210 [Paenibacillus lautus]|nr:hypothetical protein J14TS5_10210 [Paenibacillus lautus]
MIALTLALSEVKLRKNSLKNYGGDEYETSDDNSNDNAAAYIE